ncbi:Prokaryotic metallothionein [Saccharothrix sp. ALI-22-I]|uniref:Prokaryotic metallothionein n=1 Tax=Saccharothrix sp. ALI-22-I TaxID=1933778 RepID=UPI00097C9638|nr:Prokaryotic metallothionein [Saccharothrix sp. ALI-22-I]ONI84045.1 Prokaryotic metallothionein [Saccharothrix sp. ALI-22-I]
MATCDVCGNDYWMAFEVRTVGGGVYTFDSFECAAQRLAPRCEHCDCRILGHGVEVQGRFFCCAHCARSADSLGAEIRDTVGAHPG